MQIYAQLPIEASPPVSFTVGDGKLFGECWQVLKRNAIFASKYPRRNEIRCLHLGVFTCDVKMWPTTVSPTHHCSTDSTEMEKHQFVEPERLAARDHFPLSCCVTSISWDRRFVTECKRYSSVFEGRAHSLVVAAFQRSLCFGMLIVFVGTFVGLCFNLFGHLRPSQPSRTQILCPGAGVAGRSGPLVS